MIPGMSLKPKRRRRKPDLFSILLVTVTVGMSVTLAYQVNLYHGSGELPLAKQTPPANSVGG
ncbi:hypothetical protein HF203_06070 [Marichromatium bheemlicum]|uniref:Uncharacterized protein n=2 Tax=Marichromatium bheemlicum TaxID=365339 RepID=A0ABX1I5D5_9GAMM|nr:hypothetical protein [Marichromatium bheemlicum]